MIIVPEQLPAAAHNFPSKNDYVVYWLMRQTDRNLVSWPIRDFAVAN